jgi:hypothetical protein
MQASAFFTFDLRSTPRSESSLETPQSPRNICFPSAYAMQQVTLAKFDLRCSPQEHFLPFGICECEQRCRKGD